MSSQSGPASIHIEPPSRRPCGTWPGLPGSKSLTQRYFNLALLGGLRLRVHRPLISEDTQHYLKALETCGCRIERQSDKVLIDARHRASRNVDRSEVGQGTEIFCGAGGTMMRFMTATLAVIPGTWQLDGIARLRQRPAAPLLAALRQLGAEIRCLRDDAEAPLEIVGASLRGGVVGLDAGASSQFLSALLMAGSALQEPLEVQLEALTSAPYVDLTLDAMRQLGASVSVLDDGRYRVEPGGLRDGEVDVEADYSAAAYPAAAAAVTGGEVLLSGLQDDSRQGDRQFLDLLQRMGADIRWTDQGLRILGGPLHAIEADLASIPDQVPTLAALAPFARGTTHIHGVPHLRFKESDRLAAMSQELRRAGAQVEELPDGLRIEGLWHDQAAPSTPVSIATHGDHRIAMAMALVGLRRPGLSLRDPHVVAKSYPDFWQHLRTWLTS